MVAEMMEISFLVGSMYLGKIVVVVSQTTAKYIKWKKPENKYE